MTATDSIEIKVYVRDPQAAVMRVYVTKTISGVQTDPSYFVPYVPTRQYRVTLRRLAGTPDKAYTWLRSEVT